MRQNASFEFFQANFRVMQLRPFVFYFSTSVPFIHSLLSTCNRMDIRKLAINKPQTFKLRHPYRPSNVLYWTKQACMHEWVLFTCFTNIMTCAVCTQYDESSKFIVVRGIIFLHNSDRIVNNVEPVDKARHHAAICITSLKAC